MSCCKKISGGNGRRGISRPNERYRRPQKHYIHKQLLWERYCLLPSCISQFEQPLNTLWENALSLFSQRVSLLIASHKKKKKTMHHGTFSQRAPNPPAFAQPRLSRSKWHRSTNTPKVVASHRSKTSHAGTNTPKFVPSDRRLTYSNRAVKIRVGLDWAVIGGGAKRMGGGKRTRERALPKIFWPLQKGFWSARSWIFVQKKQSTDAWGGWKTYRTRGGPKPPFGRGVIREVFHPPLFSTPPWRPLVGARWFSSSCGHFKHTILEWRGIGDKLPSHG